MIRLETTAGFEVSRRRRWVVLAIGQDKYLIDPSEAVDLSNALVDATEQAVTE